MTKKLIMILGLVLSSMLMKAQAFCAFPEGWRQVLAEAGAGGSEDWQNPPSGRYGSSRI